MRWSVCIVAFVGCTTLFLPVVAAPVPKTPETNPVSGWEYKAVAFGADEKAGTKKLNELANDGWEFVGPLGSGLVAFKRAVLTPAEAAAKKELAKWAGDYQLDDGGSFTVKGDRWTMKGPGAEGYSGKIKVIDVGDKMTSADLLVEEGETKGKAVKAIFRLEGETLHYCGTYDLERPTEFKGDSDPYYYAWKRAKE
ncbi:hypothetical protein [Limnoglobus roseus]|uniref:TIGR03067 domain-containing protein n=1 Tax=Limnoglobus roseus TaxID=2598579 RepID=A0A5C1AN63_9BACT|nr:hypothetical protein [Limnoglobus roseus]QEL19577.1 TIGR03067 domain-containing protein [Limnoglobus roseus]